MTSLARSTASPTSSRKAPRAALGGAALVAALLCAAPASAQDLEAGRKAALACQNCHGMDGLSRLPDAPHLAGQPEIYLARTLRQYRSGERKHELMNIAARTLSDADIRNLAAYYAAIAIEVKPPR
jgi:cytochrome c553